MLIPFISFSRNCIYFCPSNCYSSLHMDKGTTTVAWIQLHHQGLELYFTICVLYYNIIHLNLIFFLNFNGSLLVLPSKFIIFWYSFLSICIYIYNNWSLSVIACCFTSGMYLSLGIHIDCTNNHLFARLLIFFDPHKYSLKQRSQSSQ